jgi:hypothetical protein
MVRRLAAIPGRRPRPAVRRRAWGSPETLRGCERIDSSTQ